MLLLQPESHLHPSAINELLLNLKDFAVNNPVVVSTHSPFFLDRKDSKRHLLVKKEEGISTVDKVDCYNILDENIFLQAFGLEFIEQILCKNMIVVEGESDKVIIL